MCVCVLRFVCHGDCESLHVSKPFPLVKGGISPAFFAFTHDFAGKIVLSDPLGRVGGRGVCEGSRGEFDPDPGQSPAEPAENTKHLLEWRIAANAHFLFLCGC